MFINMGISGEFLHKSFQIKDVNIIASFAIGKTYIIVFSILCMSLTFFLSASISKLLFANVS